MSKKIISINDRINLLVSFICSNDREQPEEWKEIKNSNGKYFISNQGRVLSLQHRIPRVLKPYERSHYLTVKIFSKPQSIHRLVAEYFISDKIVNDKTLVVHHKDGNKLNNVYTNLSVMTYTDHYKIHTERGKKNDK